MIRAARSAVLCALALGPASAIGAGAGAPPDNAPEILPQARPPAMPVLSTLRQTVRHFDFDDPEAAPGALPVPFYRYISPEQGFPPFGETRLTKGEHFGPAEAPGGSLEFDLAGGSMSVRLPTSAVPVLPLADYVVTARVRTEGLTHARARLVGWLHDRAGRPIASSVVTSRLANTDGAWELLSFEVHGDFPEAADLVVELQLVQPAQFGGEERAGAALHFQDIAGRAWFDELIVAHLPRMRLTMADGRNVIRKPAAPALHVQVSELTDGPLSARLRAFDLAGRCVYDATFPAPRGRQDLIAPVPVGECGWYRAVLTVTSGAGLQRERWLDFVLLPERDRRLSARSSGLAVAMGDAASSDAAAAGIPELMAMLRCGAAIVPAWSVHSGSPSDQPAQKARKRLVEQLLSRNVELLFSIDCVPEQLARLLSLQPSQALELLEREPRLWRPYLDDLLVNFGLHARRWIIGPAGSAAAFDPQRLAAVLDRAGRSLADFVPEPVFHPSWSVVEDWQEPRDARALTVPHTVLPSALEWYVGSADDRAQENVVMLEPLPASEFPPGQRAADLMVRALHAWRAGVPLLAIPAPWRGGTTEGQGLMPDPLFGPWRALSEQLAGRRFAGELRLPDGLHCWILQGQTHADAAVVAWCDDAAVQRRPDTTSAGAQPRDETGTRLLTTQLATGPVEVIDAFGNSSIEPLRDRMHSIPLGHMPVFVQRVNLELVQFRSGMSIEPEFVPAISKVHEHELVLKNPWDLAISGTIRLLPDGEQWQLSPTVQEFVIRPRGQVRLPLHIVPLRSILAGPKRLRAEVTFNANQTYSLAMHADLEVGLKNIELAASWTTVRNTQTGQDDLIITQAVTNKDQRPVSLEVYVLASGISQTRRTIGALESGETAVRSFRIPNGAATLAGAQVRVGVTERDGLTRLNRMLTITHRGGDSERATAMDR